MPTNGRVLQTNGKCGRGFRERMPIVANLLLGPGSRHRSALNASVVIVTEFSPGAELHSRFAIARRDWVVGLASDT